MKKYIHVDFTKKKLHQCNLCKFCDFRPWGPRSLVECAARCSMPATCLAFSFNAAVCEVGGDPGELSPSEPSATPMPVNYTTKLITGSRAIQAKKCKKGKNDLF